jgi:HEAT repeat protein
MSDPVEIPFEEVISALLDESIRPHPRYLSRLSDLEADDIAMLVEAWPRLPVERRQALMEQLEELGADDDLLSFEAIGRQAILDEDPRARTLAVRILWQFDHDDLLPKFLDLLETDAEADVRTAAAAGLGQYVYLGELEELSQEQLHDLEERLLRAIARDEAPQVRRKALESIGFSGRPEVPELIEKAFDSGDRDWMMAALVAMGRSMDSRWEQSVLSVLQSKTPAVRAEAARAAGELEIAASVDALVDLTEDSEESVSSAAIWSLSQIGGEQARQTLEDMFRETEEKEQVEFLEIALDNLAFTEGLQPFSLSSFDDEKTEQELYEMLLREEGYWDSEDEIGIPFDAIDDVDDLLDLDDFDEEEEDLRD